MSQQSYWKGGGKDALLGKAVVSPTGHVVAKNYDPKQLHEGDLGLSVRIDRKFEEMTPEQRMAAGGIVDELAALLRTGVGAADEDLGFKRGMVVRADNAGDAQQMYGLIERITPHSVLLRVVSKNYKVVLKQLPLGVWALEECHGRVGLEGLVLEFIFDHGPGNIRAPRNETEWQHGDFCLELIRNLQSAEAILECFESWWSVLPWIAKHRLNEDLRKQILEKYDNVGNGESTVGEYVLPTVEDPETIIAWFQRVGPEGFTHRTAGHIKIALRRFNELRPAKELFTKLSESLSGEWLPRINEM